MSLEIRSWTVQKLGHETPEIRIRTLVHLQAKIARAIAHNEEISFNAGELLKYLVRWFGQQPLECEEVALELMLTVIQSVHFRDAIETLRIPRLQKELEKIAYIIESQEAQRILKDIMNYLQDYEEISEVIEISDSESVVEIESDSDSNLDEYVPAWSAVSAPDYNSLKTFTDLITTNREKTELRNALLHLGMKLQDYPADYFLQPPYVFSALIALTDNPIPIQREVFSVLWRLVKSLSGRIKLRLHPATYQPGDANVLSGRKQISIQKFCSDILTRTIDHLKKNADIHLIFKLLSTIMDFLEQPNCPYVTLVSHAKDLSSIARSYRTSLENDPTNRIKYLNTICLVTRMVNYEKTNGDGLVDDYELQTAKLDIPLMRLYPQQYGNIEIEMDADMKLLLNAKQWLQPVVEMLQNGDNLNDADVIAKTSAVLDTLAIHESIDLVQRILNAVFNCIPLYEMNQELQAISEKLLLRLLAQDNCKIKSLVYRDVANCMKRYFAGLMDGRRAGLVFGLPLTAQMLSEIICFGCDHNDNTIRTNAEAILSLILKGRHLLGRNWIDISPIINPNLPLLQCLQVDQALTTAIVNLLDPDSPLDISFLELLQGNVRLLFHSKASIRSEAVARLIYILSVADKTNSYKPNVLEISDTIPNDVCALQTPRDPDRIYVGSELGQGQYEADTVNTLLALLNSSDVEPVVRKTVLMQLNVMCQDEQICRLMHTDCGWYAVLQALDSSLRKNSECDYTDTSIPAIGIISKLVLSDQRFRCELAKELDIYMVVIRSLFMYHTDITLQQDASLCLFLLAFSTYASGGRRLMIPKVMASLKLPIKCEFQMSKSSAASKPTEIEDGFLKLAENSEEGLQYFRISFAELWSDGYENILKTNSKYIGRLHLTKSDLKLIKANSMYENIKFALKCISNAVEHNKVIEAMAKIKICLLIQSNEACIETEEVVAILRKFLLMPPSTDLDALLFEEVVEVLQAFVQTGHEGLTKWLIASVKGRQNAILMLLRNFDISVSLYEKICILLGRLVEVARDADFCEELYAYVLPTAESCFKTRQLDHLRCLLRVLEVLTYMNTTVSIERTYKMFIYFAISLKSTSQIGSDLQKHCLRIIGKLSKRLDTLRPHENYLKYLSGLCAHQDFEVRTLAWGILEIFAKNRDAAVALVKVLAYLPGGFEACCLSTLLDGNEIAAVRITAGDVLAHLIAAKTSEEAVFTEMFQKYTFYDGVVNSLMFYKADDVLTEFVGQLEGSHSTGRQKLTTPDIVRVYCNILSSIRQDTTTHEAFYFRLAEILKQHESSTTHSSSSSVAFIQMSAEICNLFIRIEGLTKILCQDQTFISTLCTLLTPCNMKKAHLGNILKYLMILAGDKFAFQFICEYLCNNNIGALCQVLMESIRAEDTPGVVFCTFFLIKSQLQPYSHVTFSEMLDTTLLDDCSASELMFNEMEKIFSKHFSLKTNRFQQGPKAGKVVISEAIAVLLTSCPKARQAAHKSRFCRKILEILKNFFANFDIPCTTFIRKYGEFKKIPIVHNFKILYGIILNWFCVDTLTDETDALDIARVIHQTWPWLAHSKDLKEILLKTLSFLTATSLPVCKQMCTQTILSLVAKLVMDETNKIKTQADSAEVMRTSLLILTNCCSSQEGRKTLIKLGVLGVFDRFYPLDAKAQKNQFADINAWLQFWEVLTRYPEGATSRHLPLLGTLVQKSPTSRIICLRILRNMSFLLNNRPTLMGSSDFLYTVGYIFSNGSNEEKLIVATAIWKLIAGNSKAKSILKGTGIVKRIKGVQEELAISTTRSSDGQEDDLFNVNAIILKILYS